MANIEYWTMKNGTNISIDDMDENHLRNTLKMIIRNNRLRQEAENIDAEDERRREALAHAQDWMWK